MKKPSDEIQIPQLSQEVKKMNGKSGYKLRECIDNLCEIMDEDGGNNKKLPEDN